MGTVAPRVRQTRLDKLHINKANPRRISDERLASLKRALEADPEMLQARPLIALPDGRVIAGNMRLRAALELGWKTIPAITVDLDEARAQQWLLRDNQEYGEWEDASLAMLLEDLAAQGADLDLTGFADDAVSRLLDTLAASSDQEPPTPAAPALQEKWVTASGQLWDVGRHRIICGDCRDVAIIGRLVESSKPHLICADPPYNVNYRGGTNKTGPGIQRERADAYHDTFADYEAFIAAALTSAGAVCEKKAALMLWHSSSESLAIHQAMGETGWQQRSLIVWDKGSIKGGLGQTGKQYRTRFEPCVYAHRRGQSPYWYGPGNESDLWEVAGPVSNPLHPTMKPVELYERTLRNHTRRGDYVLELFSGSGTTLIACEQMGRCGLAVEIDPGFVAVALERLSALGLEPRLAESA